MYTNLVIYRVISPQYERLCWVDMSKFERHLRTACITITRLLCGNSSLALYKHHTPELKICKQCNLNVPECLFHFIMICDKFSCDRKYMFDKVYYSVKQETKEILMNITPNIYFNILLGMNYIINVDDLYIIRKIAVNAIHNMYNKRRLLE